MDTNNVIDTNKNVSDRNGTGKEIIYNTTTEKFNLILFSAGKLVSLLGTYIYSFAISLYILRVTGSGVSFALSILLGTLPRVILSPVAGSLSDRVDKRKMIVGLDILSGVIILLLFASSMLYGLKLPFIYTATFLLAVISTFFNTCFSAAIPKLVTDKKLVTINSYNRAIDSGSQVLGPIFAGMAFGIVSMNLFLLINGISFILSAISEIFIDYDLNKSGNEQKAVGNISIKTVLSDLREVFTYMKETKFLLILIPFSMTFNLLLTASLTVVLPFLIINIIGMSSMQYGLIEGAFSVGMLLAALIIGKLPEKEKKLKSLTIGIIGMGLTMVMMGVPGLEVFRNMNGYLIFGIYIIMCLLFAFFLLMVDLPLAVVIQRTIPEHMLGRVMGVLSMLSSSLMPLGIILAGVSMDIIPAYILYLVAGIYFVASGVFIYKNRTMQEY